MVITFLSDFGLNDEWVGTCKGVIKRVAPEVEIIDLSHQIESFDLKKGALLLARALPYMPLGVHLAVVDPGVGTKRKGIVIKTERGDFLVGPNNGLLFLATQRLGGIKKVVQISNEKYFLKPISATFQARDVFSPVAAYLAKGVNMEEFGSKLNEKDLVRLPFKKAKVSGSKIEGEVIEVEKFGTVRLSITSEELKRIGISLGDELLLAWESKKVVLPFLKTFAQLGKGKPLLLIDSSECLCLAINQGDAAQKFGLGVGDKVTLTK